MNCRVQ